MADADPVDEYLAPNVPPEMAEREKWVCFELVTRRNADGESVVTKVPRMPWADGDDHLDPANQTTLAEAAKWAEVTLGQHKIGFVFDADGPFIGVDLDDCRDPDTGEVEEWAAEIVDYLDSYTVVSVSGTGLHVYAKGTLDEATKNDQRGVEMYDRDRFFSWTGDLHGGYVDPKPRPVAIDALARRYRTDAGTVEDTDPVYPDDADPSEMEGESALFDLDVTDVFPTLPTETNIAHPIHGSTTGSNFKIARDGTTATCWRGEHRYGGSQGCGLNAQHLLAMINLGKKRCDRVRKDWPDAELVHAAYVEAATRGLIDPSPPPWLAVQYVAEEYDVGGLHDGGKGAWAAYRACVRILRHTTGLSIDLDDDGTPGRGSA